MDTKTSPNCPSCGTLLDQKADSIAVGLCPSCLLAESLHSTIAGQPASSPPPSIEEISAAFPDLEVIELIGTGGMGAVYKARQKSLDRLVALKLLPESLAVDLEFAKRFEAEAKALATLNHPNIVTIHDFGKQEDFYFLLMEFVDGPNLRQLILEQQLSPDEALAIVPPLCEALEFAHGKNIVHRDIKPENILLDTHGRVKVADFGIAKILGQTSTDTDSEKAAGTPAYMAPEQKDSPPTVDTRADIYSLGVVFYEMLTGERPSNDLTPPSGKNTSLDIRLDKVVLRALDANPKLRWQSANALNTELQTILTKQLGEPKVAPPENLPTSGPKRAWLACALAVTALVLFLGGYFANNHVVPVSASEHHEAVEEWFDFLVWKGDLSGKHEALRVIPQRTPVVQLALDELSQQLKKDVYAHSRKYEKVNGVKKPLLGRNDFGRVKIFCGALGLLALFIGRRHLSWLRGQEEPLPALIPSCIGALLWPLLVASGFIFVAVIRYHSFLVNTIGIFCVLLLSFWTVGRVLAWTRNLRNAPTFSVVKVLAIALIALAVSAPLTSVKDGYKLAYRELLEASFEASSSHQEYILRMHSKDSTLSRSEKLDKGKLGCEDYAQKAQRFVLFDSKPFKIKIPEGKNFIITLLLSFLSLAAGIVLILKFRIPQT